MGPSDRTSGTSGASAGSGGFSGRRSGAFGDQDAEELFRAFFGSSSSSAGYGAGASARSGPSSSTTVDAHAGGLVIRLLKAFKANPWTLVTLLSGFASLANVAESLSQLVSGKFFLVVPCVLAAAACCHAEYRRGGLMALAVFVFSGFW
ncbi:unnamed protein product [Polarella glacialis]|nr:unnamed protein product [Polarella glacialis]